MLVTRKFLCCLVLFICTVNAYCQQSQSNSFSVVVMSEKARPANGATVKLLKDYKALKTVAANAAGNQQNDDNKSDPLALAAAFSCFPALRSIDAKLSQLR